jgi:hypothetical protein
MSNTLTVVFDKSSMDSKLLIIHRSITQNTSLSIAKCQDEFEG